MNSADNPRDGSRPAASGVSELQALAVELRRMNGEINRLVHSFAHAQGLHATDVQALGAILDADPPLTPGRLREHLGLTSGAVTACLDRLERAGHIRRARESADRRVVHLYYEPGAKAVARSFFMPLAEAAAGACSATEPEELEAVLRFLGRMNGELNRMQVPRR
ncbi:MULTISPECIES: MarR family winged helix-turn-helix transcriptional regulator [unclassified Streptomyces]|uniref:MarR family winged helix-turn-helix transcriptional regulator n=1 Tax=unclassified Streptomyces TaxID=2593676 RepID=UPI00093FFD5C|nr:helix-turn-helix domain-containing protein [Streptomyces sp. CB02058]OKI94753.1 MarR family transcriptional regulator [Streptomyces sp. CB02058]